MPYKDKEKQREYQREWVRQKRSNVEPDLSNPVEPLLDPKEKLEKFLKIEGNKIVGIKQVKQASTPEEVPLYNPRKSKPGDEVIYKGKKVVVPELDGDGREVPSYW